VVKVLSDNLALSQELLAKWRNMVLHGALELLFLPYPDDLKLDELDKGTGSIRIDQIITDLPDKYVSDINRLIEWWGRALGLGYSTEDPAELLEEAQDMLEQFQYDQMLSLEEAIAFQDRLERFEQSINYVEPKPLEEISESTPILKYVRALTGKSLSKDIGIWGT
jgi:hypothetical protein